MTNLRRLRSLFRRRQRDSEAAEEMRHHLELQAERNRAAGMSDEEAAFAAQRQFGNLASLREEARQQGGGLWLDRTGQDLRLAMRALRQHPGYAATVVLTLALGIGTNVTVFSFFRGILLRPLPLADATRTVMMKAAAGDYGEVVGAPIGLYTADFEDLEKRARSFESVAAYTAEVVTQEDRDRPELVFGAIVSPDFFHVLGVPAAAGRTFSRADLAGGGRKVVLSHAFWRRKFGSDPSVVGRTIVFNRVSATVAGVAPPDFDMPRDAEFWISPARNAPENVLGGPPFDAAGRGNPVWTVLGRLRPGVGLAQAEQELRALVATLPNPNRTARPVHLVTLRDQFLGNVRPALAMLLAGVGLVLV
ncbi:MAG TPA: ABC transporter permease, partial [Vicinamibacteria bacterium]|nr:ABC transporter permease [Vicinamibacteria bacterium]